MPGMLGENAAWVVPPSAVFSAGMVRRDDTGSWATPCSFTINLTGWVDRIETGRALRSRPRSQHTHTQTNTHTHAETDVDQNLSNNSFYDELVLSEQIPGQYMTSDTSKCAVRPLCPC